MNAKNELQTIAAEASAVTEGLPDLVVDNDDALAIAEEILRGVESLQGRMASVVDARIKELNDELRALKKDKAMPDEALRVARNTIRNAIEDYKKTKPAD